MGVKGDERGEYTYTGGRDNTMIDYVVGDEEVRERIRKLEVEGRVDSDHHPLVVTIEGGKEVRRKKVRGEEGVEGNTG